MSKSEPVFAGFVEILSGPMDGNPLYKCDNCGNDVYGIMIIDFEYRNPISLCQECTISFVNDIISTAISFIQ